MTLNEYSVRRAELLVAQERLGDELRALEVSVDDAQRTAFTYTHPDGKHWFPTLVQTLEAERDAALATVAMFREWEALEYRTPVGKRP